MAGEVTISSSIRSNLLSLQNTADLVSRTNSRLSTGKKVSSAIDDAVAYFQAKGLSDRASDLASRKDNIDQGISTLQSALTGIQSVEKILTQMKGIMLSAKSATDSERSSLGTQLNSLSEQLNYLANDTSYQGLNLLNSSQANLKVQFSDKSAAILQVDGNDVRMSAGAVLSAVAGLDASTIASSQGLAAMAATAAMAGFSSVGTSVSIFDSYIAMFDSGISNVRNIAKSLGGNVALLQTRADYTKEYINTMKIGSDKLTLADLNEEGANLVSLQTRQQLGIQALSFAGQSEQGVLALLR